ncbi:hypothetical protein BH11PLA2_BH11PLA2_51630 [soil metagenome]
MAWTVEQWKAIEYFHGTDNERHEEYGRLEAAFTAATVRTGLYTMTEARKVYQQGLDFIVKMKSVSGQLRSHHNPYHIDRVHREHISFMRREDVTPSDAYDFTVKHNHIRFDPLWPVYNEVTSALIAMAQHISGKAHSDTLPEWASARELAIIVGKADATVDAKLRRLRVKKKSCYLEVEKQSRSDPGYLYRTADVVDDLRD